VRHGGELLSAFHHALLDLFQLLLVLRKHVLRAQRLQLGVHVLVGVVVVVHLLVGGARLGVDELVEVRDHQDGPGRFFDLLRHRLLLGQVELLGLEVRELLLHELLGQHGATLGRVVFRALRLGHATEVFIQKFARDRPVAHARGQLLLVRGDLCGIRLLGAAGCNERGQRYQGKQITNPFHTGTNLLVISSHRDRDA